MILLGFAAIGFIVGLLSGGSPRGVFHYTLKGILLPIAAYVLKAGAAFLLAPQTGAVLVALLQYGLLFLFLFVNRRRPVWPLVAFAGTLFNFLVIVLNGGCMPVSASLLSTAGERLTQLADGRIYAYRLMEATTRLSFLGDIIRIGSADRPLGFASIGDLVLGIGVGILCWQMMRAPQETEEGGLK
ncbi:MAG: DUF5317 domain-containing protein [Eubacteriales bacterium]|nr:DUF5317 domain-containing protein [Eubacteriales bacterium]